MQVVGSRGKKALALQQGLGCGSRMVLTHTVSGKDAGAPTPTPHLAQLRGWKTGVPSGHGAPGAGGGALFCGMRLSWGHEVEGKGGMLSPAALPASLSRAWLGV